MFIVIYKHGKQILGISASPIWNYAPARKEGRTVTDSIKLEFCAVNDISYMFCKYYATITGLSQLQWIHVGWIGKSSSHD